MMPQSNLDYKIATDIKKNHTPIKGGETFFADGGWRAEPSAPEKTVTALL
jgi:hypothetical protein